MLYKIIYIKLFNFYFILLSFLLHLPQADAFLLTAVSTCIRSFDTNNSTQSITRRYQHTATEGPFYLSAVKTIFV